MSGRRIAAAVAVLALVAGWYWFRPERAFLDRRVEEPLPVAGETPAVMASGSFRGNAHETNGTATVYRRPGGATFLRLDQFATSDGPDLKVYLLEVADADSFQAGRDGFLSLGELKGNIGPQNYDLPPGTDLTRYRAVTIWCERFGIPFGTAALDRP